MLFLLLNLAWAAEPTVEIGEDGLVRGQVVVSASTEAVLALLGDPERINAVNGGQGKVTAKPDGDCIRSEEVHPHPIATVAYTVRICPTKDGFSETLVEPGDMKRYVSQWHVTTTPAGTKIAYELDIQPDIPVPAWIVRKSTKRSVQHLLTRIAAHLEQE